MYVKCFRVDKIDIYSGDKGQLIIDNCIFSENTSGSGAGVRFAAQNMETEVTNCTFSNNHGAAMDLGFGDVTNKLSVQNSIFWGNTTNSLNDGICLNT